MEDKRKILENDQPFSWKILKSEKAFIYWQNKIIKTISGKQLIRLEALIDRGHDFDIQLYLAKITGNFKHGNE